MFLVKALYIKCFVASLAIFILSGGSLSAQKTIDLNLKLKHSDNKAPMPRSGEFNLSLDSQLFERSLLDESLEKPDTTLTGLESQKENAELELHNFSDPLAAFPRAEPDFDESLAASSRNFSSTLTLTNGYSQLSLNENSNESLRLEKKLGKFKILGEFEQQTITRIPLPEGNTTSFIANANQPLTRASLINSPSAETDLQSKNSALASRYYLEAVYSFKPTVQGKLSYRRSMVDTIESEEKLQFEGVVEANRNVLIKAGFNNETRPEVNEPKATKDSKVWTEFILKF